MLTPKTPSELWNFLPAKKHRYPLSAVSDCIMIAIRNEELSSLLNRDKDLRIKILSNLVLELYKKINSDNEIILNLYNTNTLEIFNL